MPGFEQGLGVVHEQDSTMDSIQRDAELVSGVSCCVLCACIFILSNAIYYFSSTLL